MSQHSPAPWSISYGNTVHDTVGDTVAGVHGTEAEEEAANVRLIAAAPDMLAALKVDEAFQTMGYTQKAVNWLVAQGIEVPCVPPYGNDLGNFQKELRRAAISRAEGL